MSTPLWLEWSRRLQAIAQTGLTYANSPYDVERYQEIRHLAVELATAAVDLPDTTILRSLFEKGDGYATPKVDVRAVVFDGEGKILLVREREDAAGRYQAVGPMSARRPAATPPARSRKSRVTMWRRANCWPSYDRDRHGHPPIPWHAYKLFFLCELTGGSAAESDETDGVGFFAEDAIPPLSLTRTMPPRSLTCSIIAAIPSGRPVSINHGF